ncbi:MAG: MaoC/PaaZ C-terminal domain-containing protein [Bacillus sp. (in: firmicutes)]
MLLSKKSKIGRKIEEIEIGEKLTLTEKIEDKDLLLYLGLTGDSNPLYIQHDFAALTPYKKPVVPIIMLSGIITSAISKYLPGPGSFITHHDITYEKPVYHYENVQFLFQVVEVHKTVNTIIILVEGQNEQGETVIEGRVTVSPPRDLMEQ